uniref:Uncharacterized protein n=2 Tax=viral metagenome TaxID=1070528 RepID=A0A6M3L836_9ZZZZ
MKSTVKIDLIKVIIAHWPTVHSHVIHSAGRDYCISGSQRLRELRKKYKFAYTYGDHKYYFWFTPLKEFQEILKAEMEGK